MSLRIERIQTFRTEWHGNTNLQTLRHTLPVYNIRWIKMPLIFGVAVKSFIDYCVSLNFTISCNAQRSRFYRQIKQNIRTLLSENS